MFTEIFVSLLVITAVTGYSVAHDVPKETVKAQEIVVTPTPAPTIAPKPTCSTVTPFDSEIEAVWGDEACNAKRVLHWNDVDGNSYGENGHFITLNADRQNKDLSWDRGLMRVNSNTFASYLKRMPTLLHNNDIYTWDDMLDPVKNIKMGHIIWLYAGYCSWYAAPPSLCSNNYPNVKEAN
jgi:hypothetical protein